MNLIASIFSKWFVLRSQYETIQTLAQTYLEQLEDHEVKIKGASRAIEANNIMASYIKRIALETVFYEVEDKDLETDCFYIILLDSVKALRHSLDQRVKDLRKIGAIALQDGDFETSLGSITEEDIDRILRSIAGLRGRISDLEVEKESLIRGEIADLKEESLNCIESLKLSQQEVANLQEQFEDVRTRAKDHIEELTKLRRDRIVLISNSSTIANRVREEMDLLTNSYIPLD